MSYNQYKVPPDYAIPNPWGPRIHNWKGGFMDEGSLYHGPIYTRPAYQLPWIARPLQGFCLSASETALITAFMAQAIILNEDAKVIPERIAAAETDKERDELQEKLLGCIQKHAPNVASTALTEDQLFRVYRCFFREPAFTTPMLIFAVVLTTFAGTAYLVTKMQNK